jgi:HlyD family secretion protein
VKTGEGMDRPVDQRARRKARLARYAIAGACAAVALLLLFLRDNRSRVNVDPDRITTAKVRRDVFQDYVAVIGAVEPIQTVFIEATEGGRVEEIFIREGTAVKKGDDIIRISNERLVLDIANYETEVARAINDLRSMRVTLENQEHQNQSQLINYHYDLCKLERDVGINEQLIKKDLISKEAYELSREDCARKKELYELLKRKSASDAVTFKARISAGEEMVDSMQKNLAVSRSRLDTLRVKAPVDGELATLEPELGQVIPYGARIGTINILDSYKVKAEVDEHYIARVRLKLKASCEFSGKEFPATVSKVYPEVRAGKFAVDLVFSGDVPKEIRIGQTSRIRLELGESETAILVPRGGFYQSTGGQWIYVVDKWSRVASRRNIRLGRQNPEYYEVLEGLEAGEEVITSGYETFGNMDEVVLKGDKVDNRASEGTPLTKTEP